MKRNNYLVLYEKDGITYKLCRIFFGSDGSYFVTSPYHPSSQAHLFKMTVNYAHQDMEIPVQQLVDSASADDDDKRIKLSHHPSGLVQFSGEGIASGVDAAGNIRGVGVMSWPLDNPVKGPSFGVTIFGVEQYQKVDEVKGDACLFRDSEIAKLAGANALALEGHYFPPRFRRFVRKEPDGTDSISVLHPSGFILKLRVIFAPDDCARPALIGLDLSARVGSFPGIDSGFILSGSTGSIRKNEKGETLGDGIYCMYPRVVEDVLRSVKFGGDDSPAQSRSPMST